MNVQWTRFHNLCALDNPRWVVLLLKSINHSIYKNWNIQICRHFLAVVGDTRDNLLQTVTPKLIRFFKEIMYIVYYLTYNCLKAPCGIMNRDLQIKPIGLLWCSVQLLFHTVRRAHVYFAMALVRNICTFPFTVGGGFSKR